MAKKPRPGRTNICFDCQNACGACSWSARFEPVPGWTAEKLLLNIGVSGNGKKRWVETYHITACPEFVPDVDKKTKKVELTESQYLYLVSNLKKRGEL